MFIQKEDKISEIGKVYVKGSGTSACLLTGKLDDEIKNMEIIDIQLSGLFAISLTKQLSMKNQKTQKQLQSNQRQTQVLRWGNFDNQIITQPQIIRPQLKVSINKVSCGWNHALFITSQGILLGTGENKYGQLGLQNNKKFYHSIIQVLKDGNVSVICAGFRQSYWSNSDNQIFGCGQSKNYELGLTNKKQIMPVVKIEYQKALQINGDKKRVKKIVCGKKFMVLLTQQKKVYGIGSNDFNCLLLNPNVSFIQKLTQILQNVTDIQSGWTHLAFININGQIMTRGRNNFGQLGRDNEQQFVQIGQKCQLIKSGTEFTFALGQSGNLYGWGWNQHMNLVNQKETEIISRPKLIKKPQNFVIKDCITYPAITILKGFQVDNQKEITAKC